jgi:glycerol-3-phosphate dehydrogenase
MRIGLMLYDALSYDRSLPGHRFLDNTETTAGEPALTTHNLNGAGSYYDAQVRLPERLCLENLIDATRHGAVVKNYTEVIAANKTNSKIESLQIRDLATGEESTLHAKVFINATGAWFDRVQQQLGNAPSRRIRTTKGIHLTCAPMVQKANVLFSPLDGRLFFVIPLLGKTWIGTTDTDFPDDPTNVRAEADDIEYLLKSVEPFFPNIRQLPIYSTNAGVRALVRQDGSESSVSRMHKIEETLPNMFSVLGGKITGYRAIAEEAANAAAARLGLTTPCRTATDLLPGGGPAPDSPFGALYGSRAPEVEKLVTAHGPIGAQARFAARHEFCRHLEDFLLRRTEYAFASDLGASVAPAALDALSEELQWDSARRDAEWAAYRRAAIRAHADLPIECPLPG